LNWFAVIWFGIGAALIGIMLFAYTLPEDPQPHPTRSEKSARLYWQPIVQEMSCVELKQILDEDNDNRFNPFPNMEVTENVKRQFTRWEYMDYEKIFPSPRGRECIEELGYPRDAPAYCQEYRRYCYAYNFTRSDEPKRWLEDNPQLKTMWFPKDWFYTDPFTMEKYTEPNEFLSKYRPDLDHYNGVIRDD